jgi:predicted nuclease of predicted toxin-antitoxin system
VKPPRFLADEDFRRDIVLAARRFDRNIDFVRAQEIGLSGAPDDAVLEFASTEGRVVVSHDVSTMTAAAIARLKANEDMSGLILVAQNSPRRAVAKNLVLIANASDPTNGSGLSSTSRGRVAS